MNFLADESVDYNVFKILENAGYNVKHVSNISPGISDIEVVNHAVKNDSIIITEDKDFGELAIRFKMNTKGIVLLRFTSLSLEEKNKIILNAFSEHCDEMYNGITVVSDKKIRIKKIDNL